IYLGGSGDGSGFADKVGTNPIWTGASSTNWSVTTNWCGDVPTASLDVVIPSGVTNMPTLTAASQCKALELNTDTKLNLGGNELTISGAVTGSGLFTGSTTSSLKTTGTASSTINFDQTTVGTTNVLKTLTIAGTNVVTILNKLVITEALLPNAGTLTLNDELTLRSTADLTARVGQVTASTPFTYGLNGKVTVERFISAGGKWRLLSVPTTNATQQTFRQSWQENGTAPSGYGARIGNNNANWQADGFDMWNAGSSSLRTYNGATNSYVGISSTNNPFTANSGYMFFIRGDRLNTSNSNSVSTTLRTSGQLNYSTQITVPANQFALIANPYASQVNFTKLTTSNLAPAFYVLDPLLAGDYGTGNYQTLYKGVLQDNNYYVFTSGGTYGNTGMLMNTIESGQAFFVKAGNQSGSIQFVETAKEAGSRLVSREPGMPIPHLRATLYTGNTVLDAAMITFDDAFSNAIDELDILKMSNTGENFSIKKNDTFLAIERRAEPSPTDTVFLNLTGVRVLPYKWLIKAEQLEATGRLAFLKDAYTNTLTPLNLNGETEYNFSIINTPTSYAPNRFTIVYQQSVVLPVTITSVTAVRSTSNTNEVMVSWKTEEERNMQNYMLEYSTNGTTFSSIATVAVNASNNGSGVYTQLNDKASAAEHFYRI
ncbi:MAG: hypothetical protein WD135_08860, partial [Ferruginibacter sp.]